MVLLSVGQHLRLWPVIKTLSPDREKLQSKYTKFSDVNHLILRSLLFDTSRAFQNYSGNAMSEFKVNFE